MTVTAAELVMCKAATSPPRRAEIYEIRVTHLDGSVSVSQCRVDHFAKAKFAVLQLADAMSKRGEHGTVSLVSAFELERFVVGPRGVRDDRHGSRKKR